MLLCSSLVVAGCSEGNLEQRSITQSDEALQVAVPPGYKLRQLAAPAVRFSMPEGLSLKVESFDPTLPAQKFRHELMLIDDQNIQVMIHVWDNPKHLEVQDWFQLYMSGFITEKSSLRQTRVTPQHFPAVVLEEPASEQAASQELTVFATRDHVYSITCIDPVSNPPAKKLFDHVVESFAPLASGTSAATEAQP
ncbi:MAG: hypothetical protein AB7S68_26040 [Polyangiaceae bacterium]